VGIEVGRQRVDGALDVGRRVGDIGSPQLLKGLLETLEPAALRKEMLIWVADTPGAVAPPLLPEKATQGGEYGSPGTCWVCVPHAVVFPSGAPEAVLPLVTGPPVVPDEPGLPGVPEVPGTVVAVEPVPPVPPPVTVWVLSTTFSVGAMVGTSVAMRTKATSSAANGP
jgi:hypothetical protein